MKEDLKAFMERDPSARSHVEILLCYPGFHALMLHRLAHSLWGRSVRLPARLISTFSRWLTGIEIHPAAQLGRRVVIDHGYGVVIGETSEVCDDVTLYQGVTLGGVSPAVDSRSQVDVKRHPTLRSGSIIGSGAQVLGPITIGENARIGANSVVTQDIAPCMTAVGIPARVVMPKHRVAEPGFAAYATVEGECPDPMRATIDNLRSQIAALQQEVDSLRGHFEQSKPGRQRGITQNPDRDLHGSPAVTDDAPRVVSER